MKNLAQLDPFIYGYFLDDTLEHGERVGLALLYAAKNIDYVYRIAPSITFFAKNLEVGLEGDYTVAGYGDEAIDGNTKALRDVGNLRVSLMVRYRF